MSVRLGFDAYGLTLPSSLLSLFGPNQLSAIDYSSLIESHLNHFIDHYKSLCSGGIPQFWFVTKTFRAAHDDAGDITPISPERCFAFDEKFYVRLLSRLMNNSCRKRHLQPLTYTYYDLPFSKRDKRFATLSGHEKWKANHTRSEHPELDTHLHSVMLIPPSLVKRFNEVVPTLESLFQGLDPANRSLHAALVPLAELRRVLLYSSKLLAQPQSLLKPLAKLQSESQRGELSRACVDLYAVLPKSKCEPIYTPPVCERELEQALIEDRKFRRRHVRGIICEQGLAPGLLSRG